MLQTGKVMIGCLCIHEELPSRAAIDHRRVCVTDVTFNTWTNLCTRIAATALNSFLRQGVENMNFSFNERTRVITAMMIWVACHRPLLLWLFTLRFSFKCSLFIVITFEQAYYILLWFCWSSVRVQKNQMKWSQAQKLIDTKRIVIDVYINIVARHYPENHRVADATRSSRDEIGSRLVAPAICTRNIIRTIREDQRRVQTAKIETDLTVIRARWLIVTLLNKVYVSSQRAIVQLSGRVSLCAIQ